MSLMDAKVGDTVVVHARRWSNTGKTHDAREARVVKVGRKYLYLEGGGVNSRAKFSRENGCERVDYGSGDRIYLPDDWAALQRRNQIVDRLRLDHGIRSNNYNFPQSTETLEAILQILDAADKESQR
ncbi:beta barrel domain-containing protein [Prescottella equi]|uniref:beta barrel domain-containing protein n=1 Tax=Rhodococcus hoagii TaxID=43767 RepID=UPI001EE9B307|nr:hypothetical protein [Prescottella equi]